ASPRACRTACRDNLERAHISEGRTSAVRRRLHNVLRRLILPRALRGAGRGFRHGMLAVQSNTRFQVKPLYMQVRDALLDRIKDGRWKPGASLPSEIDLYRQLGVSLGTLRKALGVLESEQLIVREPGRGTFVRDHQAAQALGRFNPIRGPDGVPLRGRVSSRQVKLAAPTPAERTALRLQSGERVVRIQRLR